MSDCKHERIQTWRFDTPQGEPAGMWSCVSCGIRFEPPDMALYAERDALLQEVREISGGADVLMGLLVDCIAVLHTIDPESDDEAENLRDLLDAIARALEPTRHKGELL